MPIILPLGNHDTFTHQHHRARGVRSCTYIYPLYLRRSRRWHLSLSWNLKRATPCTLVRVRVPQELGNVLKMDRHKYVKLALHGFRQLSSEQRKHTYGARPTASRQLDRRSVSPMAQPSAPQGKVAHRFGRVAPGGRGASRRSMRQHLCFCACQ